MTLNNYKSDADDTHVGKVSTFDTTPQVTSKMQPLNTILKEGWQDVESQKSIVERLPLSSYFVGLLDA